MRNKRKKLKLLVLFMFLMLATVGTTVYSTTETVQAARSKKKGFVVRGNKTYYYKKGKKVTGWQTIKKHRYYFNKKGVMKKGWLEKDGKYYFFDRKTGRLYTGWAKDSKGRYRYFGKKTGEMMVGWQKHKGKKYRYFAKSNGYLYMGLKTVKGKKYFFDESTGVIRKEWSIDSQGNYRYSNKKTGYVYTKWVSNKKGETRYFDDNTGIMYTGFHRIGNKTYYFYTNNGLMAKGWVKDTATGKQYYFDSKGVMATGTRVIDGVSCQFASDGSYIPPQPPSASGPKPVPSTGTRTLRNYLAGALQPVGEALYVWGGGWNDANRKGVSPAWKQYYDMQNSSYDFNTYRHDLSAPARAKGLDCSGFVGWATYQVMHQQSNEVSYGYTVVSGDIGPFYKKKGWGSIVNQNYLKKTNYKFYPGDIGYNSGHTWIVLGQCADTSLVIVHSTPNAGCQIAGTPTASGNYSSQAIELAKKYMSRFPGFTKYKYNTSSGHYIRNGNYLRWNDQTLSDPDGFRNMTADQILYKLYGF